MNNSFSDKKSTYYAQSVITFTEKQGELMNKLGVKFTDKTTKQEATALIEQFFKEKSSNATQAQARILDKGKYDLLPENCPHCDGQGYVMLEHHIHKSTTIAACDHCERGKYLQTRERHPIGSIPRCYALGYLPIVKAPNV